MDEKKLSREVDRVLAMVGGIKGVVLRRNAEVPALLSELGAIEGRTCVGREWWRDKEHDTKEAKLYINHSIDQACPLHGTPEPGGRLRVYVGSDEYNITDARAAMDREFQRRELEQRLGKVESGLLSCGYSITRFYDYLGYDVGADGQLRSQW